MKHALISLFILLIGSSYGLPSQDNEIQQYIMSYEDYSTKKHALPYLFSLESNDQSLYYFGGNHSVDPSNEQYIILEEYWDQFLKKTNALNCVVLVEGTLRKLAVSKDEAICHGAEGSFITFLASKTSDIVIKCPEPTYKAIDAYLNNFFTEDVITYKTYAQKALWAIKRHTINPLSSLQESFQQEYGIDLEHMETIHKKLFKEPYDITNERFFYTITNPVSTNTIINKACRKASVFRDVECIRFIKSLIQEGKNIFIVYGGTHAVMQEPAIKAVWKKHINTKN